MQSRWQSSPELTEPRPFKRYTLKASRRTDISEITDPAGFKAVGGRSQTAAADRVQKLGGRYVARTENITAVDGTPPKRFIMTAFDSAEKAQAYLKSDSQKEIDAIRTKTTKSRVFMVEGL
jgi:uncharacterized protein (DUF1330 family)